MNASLKFAPKSSLHRAIEDRVAAYLADGARVAKSWRRSLLKIVIVMGWLSGSYLYLLLVASSWWEVVIATVSSAAAMAGAGFIVQHEGSHGAMFESKSANGAAAAVLDLIGGSSYYWRHKHNYLHHQFPNVDGYDDDLVAGPWLRLGPNQRRRGIHRFQHFYAWLLYGFLAMKWHLFDDYMQFASGRINEHRVKRPRNWSLVLFFGGKVLFYGWVFVLPFLLHPWWIVAIVYLGGMGLVGVILATVFQLAHCVDICEVYTADGERSPQHSWAEHQLRTTCDFAQKSRLLTWYLGGLNYQVEHHLFPKVSVIHYPAIAKEVEAACREHGAPYHVKPSFWSALAAHMRFLRSMGQRTAS